MEEELESSNQKGNLSKMEAKVAVKQRISEPGEETDSSATKKYKKDIEAEEFSKAMHEPMEMENVSEPSADKTVNEPASSTSKVSAGKEFVFKEPVQPAQQNISCNPQLPDDDEEFEKDLERIRGDAIGETLYSERFVYSTLIKLGKLTKEDPLPKELEKSLCALWDMTTEKDVVLMLLKNDVIEVFAHCIEITDDKRLTEILIGILSNMCCFEETLIVLIKNKPIWKYLTSLISCTDSLTIIQVMRLITVAFNRADISQADTLFCNLENYTEFIEAFCNILSNSTNTTLLCTALEALSGMARIEQAKSFTELAEGSKIDFLGFFNEDLIVATFDAFELMVSKENAKEQSKAKEETQSKSKNSFEDNDDVASEESKKLQTTCNNRKAFRYFLNFHYIMAKHGNNSETRYTRHMQRLFHCLSCTLEPMCDPTVLLPLTPDLSFIAETVNDIEMAFGDPFDPLIFCKMISIWNIVETEIERSPKPFADDDPDWDHENSVDYNEFTYSIIDFIIRTLENIELDINDALEKCAAVDVKKHPKSVIQKLSKVIIDGGTAIDDDKIKVIFDAFLAKEEEEEEEDNDVAAMQEQEKEMEK